MSNPDKAVCDMVRLLLRLRSFDHGSHGNVPNAPEEWGLNVGRNQGRVQVSIFWRGRSAGFCQSYGERKVSFYETDVSSHPRWGVSEAAWWSGLREYLADVLDVAFPEGQK